MQKKLKKMDFDFNDYLDQHGTDEQDGRYRQCPEHAPGYGQQDEGHRRYDR